MESFFADPNSISVKNVKWSVTTHPRLQGLRLYQSLPLGQISFCQYGLCNPALNCSS